MCLKGVYTVTNSMLRKKRGHLYNCLEILVKLVVHLKVLVSTRYVFSFLALDAVVFFVISLMLLSQSKQVDKSTSVNLVKGHWRNLP
jgi:hypothetical protein